MEKFTALGVMSGSSLDGMDLAYCEFILKDYIWSFKILESDCYPYEEEWINTLKELGTDSSKNMLKADIEFGKLTALFVNKFIQEKKIKPNIICSHGHTIFHEPALGFTCQIGNGQTIAINTGIKTISDFRAKDISLGGQGAPLVPIGDKLLFAQYDYCINIGGIANISYDINGERIAFDICGANQILNNLSLQCGKAYDEGGKIAQLGKMNFDLFKLLNNDSYFKQDFPKSLSNDYVKTNFIDIVNEFNCSIEDKLFTCVKHIAFQLTNCLKTNGKSNILITGGGAHNEFLMDAIRRECRQDIIVADNVIIDYKEALIFAFMGILREQSLVNSLSSVTGAKTNSSGGTIFLP